jgi:antitoxin MazE
MVKLGNSRGLRLSKPLLEQVGLSDEVDIQAASGVLTIRPVARPRARRDAGDGAAPGD